MGRKNILILKKLHSLLFFLLFSLAGHSQVNQYINPADPTFRGKYENLVFDNKFVLLATADLTNNYYIADFSKLSSQFEKVYFLTLIFTSDKIVNIDGDLTHERIWFLANRKYPEKEIMPDFDKYRDQTLKKNAMLSEGDKAKWLSENDKYK
jgi:hypothetical protein